MTRDHQMAPNNMAEKLDDGSAHPVKGTTTPDETMMPDSDNGSSHYYIDPVKERRMMRKFDVS